MNEVLGLIDSLEATILESSKVPLTDKLIIEEKQLLQIIDKIRLTIKNGDVVRAAIDKNYSEENVNVNKESININRSNTVNQSDEILEKAKKIKMGAEEYANYILTNLHLTVTKLKQNLNKLEKNLESGREALDKQQLEEVKEGIDNEIK